jgi:oligopeptide/dipeptide ABC transporter ATP-binding protein
MHSLAGDRAVISPAAAAAQSLEGPLIVAQSLTKDFGGSRRFLSAPSRPVRAVHDVSLDLARGEVLGIVGESGSGKSTLGRLVLRLLEPTAGKVFFGGTDLGVLAPVEMRRFRRHMQMIFQDPFASLNARMTVGDALVEPLRLHRGLSRTDALEEAARLMEKVGLTHEQLARYPRAFSGGQRQRVAIARALASSPSFIVADEPVSALDVSIQAEILNLLQDLQRGLGLALMFISHDLSVVEVVSDRVMVLYLGRVMELAPTEALYARPAHPYSAALMAAAPGSGRKDERLILSGEIPSPSDPPSGCVFRTRCPFAVSDCARTVPPLREIAPGHRKACIRDDLVL